MNRRVLFVHEVAYETKPVFEIQELPEHLSLGKFDIAFLDLIEGFSWKGTGFFKRLAMKSRVIDSSYVRAFHQPTFVRGVFGRLVAAVMSPFYISLALARHSPSVVVLYGVPTNGWQCVLICRLLSVPVVFRALDVSHLIRRTRLKHLVRISELIVFRYSDWVSANNPELLNYAIESGARSSKASVDLPPLDLKHFEPSFPYQAGKRENRILYMGSFFYFGGLEGTLRGFASADSDCVLELVGGGEMADQLKELAHELRVQDRVIFSGFVSYHDLPKVFSKARVAINPMTKSKVSDFAFPHKVIQYLAAGLPVVSTPLEGLISNFSGSPPVLLEQTSEEVARRAISLAQMPEECDRLSRVGRESVLGRFGLPRSVSSFARLLDEVGKN